MIFMKLIYRIHFWSEEISCKQTLFLTFLYWTKIWPCDIFALALRTCICQSLKNRRSSGKLKALHHLYWWDSSFKFDSVFKVMLWRWVACHRVIHHLVAMRHESPCLCANIRRSFSIGNRLYTHGLHQDLADCQQAIAPLWLKIFDSICLFWKLDYYTKKEQA